MELFDNFWLLAKCIIICGDFSTTIERIKVGIVPNFGSKRKTTRLATSTGIICSPPYVTDDWAIFTTQPNQKFIKSQRILGNSSWCWSQEFSELFRRRHHLAFMGITISVSWEAKLFDFIISNSHLTAILTEAQFSRWQHHFPHLISFSYQLYFNPILIALDSNPNAYNMGNSKLLFLRWCVCKIH